MVDVVDRLPLPAGTVVVDLDGVTRLDITDLLAVVTRATATVGVTARTCHRHRLALAMCVDLLVAAPAATFGQPGPWTDLVVRLGVPICGRPAVKYLAMTDRTINAVRAQTWGLVNLVDHDPSSVAVELAERVAARSSIAVSTILALAHRGAATDIVQSLTTAGVHSHR